MVGKQVVIEVEYEAPYTKEKLSSYIDLRSLLSHHSHQSYHTKT
jgi:hypothetical protein